MIHGFSAADIIAIISAAGAAVAAILGAWKVNANVSSVNTKLLTRNGSTIGMQVDDLTTGAAQATAPQNRTPTQVAHLEAANVPIGADQKAPAP